MKSIKMVCLLLLLVWAAQSQTLTLKECVELSLANHPDFGQAYLQSEQASASKQITKSRMLPNMGINFYQSTNTGRSIDRFTNSYINELYNATYIQAGIKQPIFQGFRIKHQLAADKLTLDARLQQMEAIKNDLTARVIQAYLAVLQAEEIGQVTSMQVAATEEQLQKLEEQLAAGTIGKKAVLQLQTQLSNEKFAKVQADGQLKLARINLFQLMNEDDNLNLKLEGLMDSPSILFNEEPYSFMQELPEIKASKMLINSFNSQAKAIRAERLPSVNFSADWNTFYASSNAEQEFFEQLNNTRNASFAIGVNIPIFGRLQTKPREQAALVQKRIEENNLKANEMAVKQAYQTALQSYRLSEESYKSAQEQVSVNEDFLATVEEQLSAGVVNLLDYIIAKKNYDTARSTEVQQKYALALQSKILNFYKTGEWNL